MLCSNFHLQTIVQTNGRISSIRANLMRPQGLPPQSGIYRWSEIIAPRSFPAFELLVFCVFDAENQDGGIFHCVNRTTPQKPALSQCEALVSWNLAQPVLLYLLRAPFQFIQKQLQQRRLSWAHGRRLNRQSEAEFLRQRGWAVRNPSRWRGSSDRPLA